MTAAASVAQTLNHEEIFLERYNRLLKWAFQLTKPDRELAKDLVHDAYIQFTVTGGDLISINNFDNYLFGVVRNTYLPHRRKNVRQQQEQLAELEFDSSSSLLLSVDPRRQMQISDELRAICHHACNRKDTAITGSILILRFFHGYVPSEIAKLIHSSRNIVDVQLRSARAETIACLGKRKLVSRKNQDRDSHSQAKNCVGIKSDLLTELRNEVFATRRGPCLDPEQLRKIYRSHKVMPRATLSHLVSCQNCLDEANRLLSFPLLRERNAIDVLGRRSDAEGGLLYAFATLSVSFISAWPLLDFLIL